MSDIAVPARPRTDTLGPESLTRLRLLAVVGLVALNALDLILTRQLLARGGTESNPLMVLIIGGPWGVVIKLGVPLLVGLRHLRIPVARKAVLALCWMNVLYMGVVTWNFHLLVGAYA